MGCHGEPLGQTSALKEVTELHEGHKGVCSATGIE
jgi:hypothetical protein